MRNQKKWVAAIVALSLIISISVAPLPAIAIDDNATAITTEQPKAVDQTQAADQPVSLTQLQPDGLTQTQPSLGGQTKTESQGDTKQEVKAEKKPGVAGKYNGSTDFIPNCTGVVRKTPVGEDSNEKPVDINVDENYNIAVDGQAKANTGSSNADGTQATNTVGGKSNAVAVNGSDEPITANPGGTYAKNEATRSIDNSATASAVIGAAEADNTMKDNDVTITPDATVVADVSGKIINSDIKVNAQLNYWALISGQSEASSGDGNSDGLLADNLLNSNDKALAKGDRTESPADKISEGSALAGNNSDNAILNTGKALAATGESSADNTMKQNDIKIAPTVKALLNICGDVINSNITINLAYNFLAVISGFAKAETGASSATGAEVGNAINNVSSADAVGDSSLASGGNGTPASSGDAVATNDTSNMIKNGGNAIGISGDANALNSMINNAITIAPVICSQINLLNSIVNANLVINVVYNFWATVSGEADAETGATDANGLVADNSINNKSDSLAIGDSATFASSGNADGDAMASNKTDNAITNKGDAGSISGTADAFNGMFNNVVNLSPTIATAVILVEPIADNSYVINIVYDIWSNLTGSATAKSGAAKSYGAVCSSSIDSNSNAAAIAKIGFSGSGLNGFDGSAEAINSSDNSIGSVGSGAALSGDADATSVMSDAQIGITGRLCDDTMFNPNDGSIDKDVAFKARLDEKSDAKTGDASALGTLEKSNLKSKATSRDLFGGGGVSVNDSDDDIVNEGTATAVTENANAQAGLPAGSGFSDNVVLTGFSKSDTAKKEDVSAPENKPDQTGKASDETKTGEGVSMASSKGSDLHADYVGSVAGVAFYDGDRVAHLMPWWLWLIAALLAMWLALTIVLKPWRLFLHR